MRYTLTSPDDLPGLGAALRGLDYGTRWVVTVQPARDARTIEQNRYYWQCVVGGFVRWQETQGRAIHKDAVHQYLKLQRWGHETVIAGERVRWCEARSRDLSVEEFSEYIEWATAHLIDDLGMPAEYMGAT